MSVDNPEQKPAVNHELPPETAQKDYITKSELESFLAKVLAQNAKPVATKSDVVEDLKSKEVENNTTKELEIKLDKAYATRERLNKIATTLADYANIGDFYTKIIAGHQAKSYSTEIDRVNFTTKDVVAEFLNNKDFLNYLTVTDKGADATFNALPETEKIAKATEYLAVVDRALQRMQDLQLSSLKAKAGASSSNENKYLEKYLKIRNTVQYYNQQGAN